MTQHIIIAGAGIGGLGAALACARAGATVQVLEQSSMLAEVGAGIQLGPNAVRVLQSWGLGDALRAVAAFPQQLEVRHALHAQRLATLPLGDAMVQRYGAAYATVARADVHSLLLSAVQSMPTVDLLLNAQVDSLQHEAQRVQVTTQQGLVQEADALVGADGLWSRVRARVLADGPPRVSGHLAYRAMVEQVSLPAALRSQVVTVWMGPHFHVVQYPVRGGAWLNVVAIVRGPAPADIAQWDHSANADDLRSLLAGAAAPLHDLLQAIAHWRLWPLCDRPPMRSAAEQAVGRVALLGDAAHPMRPYLAQGAGMALEDAAALAHAWGRVSADGVAAALQHYAQQRWQRNARVQARSIRNGEVFHLRGVLQWGRDATLRTLGARVLDMPWLYGYRAGA
jgi:salicylate hydroxylase